MSPLNILVADDDPGHRAMLKTLLHDWGHTVCEAADGCEAIARCGQRPPPDLALVDVRMPRKDGLAALPEMLAQKPGLPVILMTAYSDIGAAVEAMRNGAWDYLTKPLDFAKLRVSLANAAEKIICGSLSQGNTPAKPPLPFLGQSEPMRQMERMLLSVAPSEATLLITGESGTGKELAARAAHAASRRAGGPFVAVNCGAFTETLLASELFGHEKGAFTGAEKKHEGLFRQAGGGSIFLDEVGEMPLAMQVRLLRVLQEREVLSVGGSKPLPIDCRVMAATNRDLAKDVEDGRFREDLYYRLNVVNIAMPPLREREGDVPALADHFASRFAQINRKRFLGITANAMRLLNAWHWPGNVRELENVMERAIILMHGEYLTERELPERLMPAKNEIVEAEPGQEILAEHMGNWPTLEEVEKRVIMRTLQRLGNNKSEAARALGITRKTLHARLNKYLKEADGE